MTPLNIGLAVAVLVLVALLWKLRHDRAERDADFDDRPIGSWATPAPAPATAAGAEVPAGAARAPAGSSWVVGGGGMDAGGWPAGPVTEPGWPHPGQMSSAWPAADAGAPQGAHPGIAPPGAAGDWLTAGAPDAVPDGPGGAIDAPLVTSSTPLIPSVPSAPAVAAAVPPDGAALPAPPTAVDAPAALPVWNPAPASPIVSAGPAVPPQGTAPDVDVDPADAWPPWEGSATAHDAPPAATEPRPDVVTAAPAPSVAGLAEGSGLWDDDEVVPPSWTDEPELAVAQHAATAVGDVVEAPPGAASGPFARLSACPGLAVPPADRCDAGRGRFALGGHAMRAGQQAVSGVTFRSPVGVPPSAWVVAPAPGAAPGTLVLYLDGAVNCGVDGLQVVMDAGFAPTEEGFTVRVAAREPGPFIASGTFEIAV